MTVPLVPLSVVAGYVLDLLIGDPPRPTHPVRLIGAGAAALEAGLRPLCRRPSALRLAGAVLVLVVVPGAYLLAELALRAPLAVPGAGRWQRFAWVALSAWLVSTAVAGRDLRRAGLAVHRALAAGDLAGARAALQQVVGRDTANLPQAEVVRGAVETVAENTVDAVVSPLFYAFLGGPALALAYRAANTLDSMVGYRNDRYRDFGWAAARLDDAANFLPARIAGLLMVLGGVLLGLDGRGAWRVWRRDARRHPSPNAGIPEAVTAGALGVRLGGANEYGGVPSGRPYLGDGAASLVPDKILAAVRLNRLASHLAAAVGVLASWPAWNGVL